METGNFQVCRCCLFAGTQWKTPGSFLEDEMSHDSGHSPIAPPQIYELHNLRTFSTLDSLLSECRKRQKVDVECWMPVYRLCRDAVIFLLPGIHSFLARI